MSKEAGFYIGEDRFIVRKKIVKDLDELGQVVKMENIKNKVGHSERTDAVIEPKLSMQWFLKMDKISKPALDNVLNGTIKLIPEKYINTYRHWMENVHDWCISRQLWWGQRIPAWYCNDMPKDRNAGKPLFLKLILGNALIAVQKISGRMKMCLIHGSPPGFGPSVFLTGLNLPEIKTSIIITLPTTL